jgi:non-haem Fe2+, alpha-ketoglutarate-dependent halogenase
MNAQTLTEKKFSLSPAELANFRRQGYAGPFTLYQPEEIKEIWRKERIRLMDRSHAIYPDNNAVSGVTNISNYDRHLDNDFLAQHVCRPEITDRVAGILGPDLLCWRSEFFPKYPGDEGTDWHQADTFANAGGEPQIVWGDEKVFGGTITVWTAFTEANIDNGCLQFIPGTHEEMFYDETKKMAYDPESINKRSKDGMKRGFFGYDYRQLQKDPDWKPDESKAISMIMRPGQFIIFWSTLMHASHPHAGKTNQMRMAFVSRYVPTCVRVYPGLEEINEYGGRISLKEYGSVLVSGSNAYDHNILRDKTTLGTPIGIGP